MFANPFPSISLMFLIAFQACHHGFLRGPATGPQPCSAETEVVSDPVGEHVANLARGPRAAKGRWPGGTRWSIQHISESE